ncbi:transcription factor tfiiib component b'' [Phtheirospermum japonicum]|uniref:Transcription factor tfiiib component b n=1 Tax=Phtheirospermum japonicum TaxID=374723 RepID=A0A830B6U9_9LAMI|nr:transcription factor tfiiib component b'' [Phtheirospermum japonicum]
MRLHDALTNRTKDNSYFKMIIENLEQEQKRKQAEEKQNAGEDGSMDLTGNEEADEETTIADDEEPKDYEHNQEEENDDVAIDGIDIQSPSMSDDGEGDDLFGWDQYKST